MKEQYGHFTREAEELQSQLEQLTDEAKGDEDKI